MVLDLTRSQRNHWVSMLEGVVALQAEDKEALSALRGVVEDLQQVDDAITPSAKPDTTVESMIDSIQTIILLNHGLMADLDTVLKFYQTTYARFQAVRNSNDLNHFRLDESVSFLGQMSEASNAYSEKLVLEALSTFEEITRSSTQIGTTVAGTMRRLMDPKNPESLDAINNRSGHIRTTLDRFLGELEGTIAFSRKSVVENLAQIEKVKVMAEAISDFSESIRMISLNLNIEAARVSQHGSGVSGKGFQVLAIKLSEFALKAQGLAKQQTEIIETASAVIDTTGNREMGLLSSLLGQIPSIKGAVDPFAAIIGNTFREFERVEDDMSSLTQSIDVKLKAVIGKLQFQDLARQEQAHVIEMFRHVRDLASEGSATSREIDLRQKDDARGQLIQLYERLATTENELAVIRQFRLAHPEAKTSGKRKDAEESVSAGSVSLF